MERIDLKDIVKAFGKAGQQTLAVDHVSLTIEPGEFFFLLGPSGCGKTTLLRIIAGLTQPSVGQVWLGDRNVTDLAVEQRNTAMVFQNYALWPHMSVRQNVEFGPKMRGAPAATRRQRAADNLTRVEMAPYAARKPNQLSGGQQQRVALARALAAQGACLLLDEPLSNLDARLRLHMRTELRRLVKDTGATAVYVTHDQKEALSMADRIAVMNAGKVVQVGTPEEIYNRPATRFVADFLGEANFVGGTVAAVIDAVARIETPVGELLVTAPVVSGRAPTSPEANPAGPSSGDKVLCCVRPERVRLSAQPPASPSANAATLPATVVESAYLGEMRQYLCELPGGNRWKISVLAGTEAAIPDGSQITLTIPAADVALLKEQG